MSIKTCIYTFVLLVSIDAKGQDCIQQRLSCNAGGTLYNTVPWAALPSGSEGNCLKYSSGTWGPSSCGSSSMPTGLITLVVSGSCPSGFTEVTALDGKMLRGTLAAHGDVGTTGGNATITPAGTVSQPSLTLNSYTPAGSVAAPTFTGTSNQTTSAVSAGTPAGTNGTVSFTPAGTNGTVSFTPSGTIAWPAGVPTAVLSWPASVPTFAGSALATHAHELPFQIPSTTTTRQIAVATFGTGTSRAATAVSAAGTANTTSAAVALSQAVSAGTPAGTIAWPASVPTAVLSWPAGVPTLTGTSGTIPAETFTGTSGTVPAETFTGSALGTHSHTLTPAGTNSAPAFTGNSATLTGTVSQPTFTGNAVDPSPPYVKVIFCSAN
jgi:hypothetical protein